MFDTLALGFVYSQNCLWQIVVIMTAGLEKRLSILRKEVHYWLLTIRVNELLFWGSVSANIGYVSKQWRRTDAFMSSFSAFWEHLSGCGGIQSTAEPGRLLVWYSRTFSIFWEPATYEPVGTLADITGPCPFQSTSILLVHTFNYPLFLRLFLMLTSNIPNSKYPGGAGSCQIIRLGPKLNWHQTKSNSMKEEKSPGDSLPAGAAVVHGSSCYTNGKPEKWKRATKKKQEKGLLLVGKKE